jgi:hypothetical protein
VSTDDVLSALIWQAVTRARHTRLESGNGTSRYDRQVDARKYLDTPSEYTGNVVHKVTSKLAVQDVLEMSLSALALHLRTSLQDADITHDVRLAATKAHRATVASRTQSPQYTFSTTRGMLPPTDVRISSWAKEDCHHPDLGRVLGRPKAVRRPSFPAWEELVYLLPKKPDGEVAVALCLRDEDLEELKRDDAFTKFCSYIG